MKPVRLLVGRQITKLQEGRKIKCFLPVDIVMKQLSDCKSSESVSVDYTQAPVCISESSHPSPFTEYTPPPPLLDPNQTAFFGRSLLEVGPVKLHGKKLEPEGSIRIRV